MRSDKENQSIKKISRRNFLQKGLMAGASVVTVATVPTQALASVEQTSKLKSKQEEGYRLSKHIAAYYKSAQL